MQTSETVHPEHVGTRDHSSHLNIGNVLGYRVENEAVRIHCERGQVVLTFPMETVLRFKVSTSDTPTLESTIALSWRGSCVSPTMEQHANGLTLKTNAMQVDIQSNPFAIRVFDGSGKLAYQLKSMCLTSEGGLLSSSVCEPADHFYGLGEKTSFLDKRGEAYQMWNSDVYDPHVPELDALYLSIPFLIHFRNGYATGVFLDNPGKSHFDMRTHTESFDISVETGDFDGYVFTAPTLSDVIQQYTSLTGRMNMPPKWAIGYHQSRYSYMSQDEVLDLARTLRDKHIPCDAIYLDIHYMDGYRVFTFDKNRFPDPVGLSQKLRELGIRLVTIVDPGVKQDLEYGPYVDGLTQDVFCEKPNGEVFIGDVWPGASAFPDFTDERAFEWWAEQQKFYLNNGISGIWNDMNEPAVFNDIKTMDLDVMHRNNGNPQPHAAVHNLYGMLMCKATQTGLQRYLDGKRPFVLTRAGYAGVQRYAAVWTGDNRSFWEHLALSIPMVLNLGLSGVPFSGVDIGGFAHHASGELLARWTQLGAFFPFCRNHSAMDTLRQEPWSFGEDIEEICRKYITLRYRWMPHFYSLFYESSTTGLPWFRPLVLAHPEDANTHNLCDQFLVGHDVLVAPAYRPDMNHRSVYLPAGGWFDYWTNQRVEGGQYILVESPLDTLPLFVREGTILPEQNVVQSTAEQATGPLTIHLYAGDFQGTFTYQLYDDDGETLAYQQGQYSLATLTFHADDESVAFHYEYQHHAYPMQYDGWLLRFKCLCARPAGIEGISECTISDLLAGRNGWAYDADANELLVRMTSIGEFGEIRVQKG